MTTCPQPECGAEVIQARDPAGGTLRLNPRPSPRGKYAAWQDPLTEVWHARLLTGDLRVGEQRYSGHTCAVLAPVREAQAKNAAATRRRAGQYRPADRSQFAGAGGAGYQVPPPDGGAAA